MSAVTQESAQLISREGVAASLQSVQIEGQLDGLLLRMTTRQHYKNTGKKNLETVYTFPLPWGATLLGLNAEIDGHRLQGTVLEKKQATQRYEKAIDAGDTPIMVERSARGLYTANLGNLQPGETAVIEIEYAQLLRFEQGQIRITIPNTVAPRYGDAHQTGGLASHESVDASLLVEYPFTASITLTGEIGLASIQCPSHSIAMTSKEGATTVKLEEGGFLDRDFVLLLLGLDGQSFVTVAPDGDQFAVLASFCPKLPKPDAEPLFLKILVDCSGSMGGDSISAARQALHEVMKEMTEQDWISYSRFGGDVQHELSLLQPCTADTVKRVAGLIAKTDADLGGTEMNHALLSTFQLGKGIKKLFGLSGRDDDQSADVLLITDGDIWNVEEVIASAKSSGHRVFAIGVGSAPSESLLREVAEKSGGACDLVSPNQDIASVIVRMFRRMRSVRCSNLTMAWGHDVLWQSTMPRALYGGDTIHCCARMAARPQTLPVLSWMAGGATVGYSPNKIQVLEGDWLSRMVAASQMGEFSEQISPRQRIEQSADDVSAPEALNAQALALALKYQLVTDQTNLLLVHVREENNKVNGLPDLEKIVHMQAAGWGGVGSVSSQSHQFRCGTTAYSLAINACASRINTRDLSDSDTTPRWRIRTSEAAALSVDALTSSCPDNFEIPAFLRSQVDSVGDLASPPARNTKTTKPVPRALRVDPLATPLDLLKTFENSSQKLLAPHRFVRQLQALNLPAELTSRLDDLTVMLGSGTKAWAVVLQWLAAKLSDQITLSRQSERLLRHVLKDEDAQRLQEMLVSLIGSFDQVSANDWHLGATVSG